MGYEGNNQIAPVRVALAEAVRALTLFYLCFECTGVLGSRRDMVNDGLN
jgi:hypothetical protein